MAQAAQFVNDLHCVHHWLCEEYDTAREREAEEQEEEAKEARAEGRAADPWAGRPASGYHEEAQEWFPRCEADVRRWLDEASTTFRLALRNEDDAPAALAARLLPPGVRATRAAVLRARVQHGEKVLGRLCAQLQVLLNDDDGEISFLYFREAFGDDVAERLSDRREAVQRLAAAWSASPARAEWGAAAEAPFADGQLAGRSRVRALPL